MGGSTGILPVPVSPWPATGKTFVLACSLSSTTHTEAKKCIEVASKTSRCVSKRTDPVHAGAAGSSLDQARKLGVGVRAEEEFLILLGKMK